MAGGTITPTAVAASVAGYVPAEAREAEDGDSSPPSMLRPLARWTDQAAEAVLAYEEAVREIETDKSLSDLGKAERIRDAFEEHMDRLDAKEFAERVELAEKELDRLRALPGPPPADDAHSIAVAGDIRRHLADLPDSDRRAFLQKNAGDPKVAAAVLHAPAYLSGLTDAEVDAFRRWAIERRHPDRVARIELLERTLEGAGRGRRNAEKMMRERGGVRYSNRHGRDLHRLEGPGSRAPMGTGVRPHPMPVKYS